MFFAVIGDIMSNFSALQQILNTLQEQGIQRILHTGNVCVGSAYARECVDLLRQHKVLCVQGRMDKAVVKMKGGKGFADTLLLRETHAALGSHAIEFLNGLPRKRAFVEEGLRILVCHGAVNCAGDTLTAATSAERFRRERELDASDIIVCGGAPEPFAFNIDKTFFVCPGTITDTAGGIRYMLVNTETSPWSALSETLC